MTEWRAIPSFPDYEASDDGRVRRRVPGARQASVECLSVQISEAGYHHVVLWVSGATRKAYVQRLVCEAFHGPAPQPKLDAAHRNGRRSDNRPSNLRWATRAENEADKVPLGLANIGERNGGAVLTADAVLEIRAKAASLPRSSGGKRIKKGALVALAAGYGVTASCLRQAIAGRRWSHL